MTPIDRELLAPSLAPFGKSTTLPAEAYTDESVFRWEQERFFDGSWVCVGRAGGLREAGDRRAVSLGRESVLLVRGEDDTLRAFYNVCRHRGHELLPVGGEACGKFVRCPYHAWAYGLDGELKGAPGFGRAGGFEKREFPLVPMRVVEWHGWLFANASGDAPPFDEHAGDLAAHIENHRCKELVVAIRHSYEVAANWKILAENYHECYHCSSIHPELSRVSPPSSGGDNLEPEGFWVGGPMDLYDGVETMSLDGRSHAPNLPHLAEGQDRTIYYFQLFPNLFISLHPDYVMAHSLLPLAPDRTAVECEWLFSREAVEAEGFDPSYASDFWDLTNRQDWHACEAVQRGISSRGYRRGPLSPREDAVYQFITMVARSYLDGRVARPASRTTEAAR
ncbi:MAG: aromatic ring-hydroxylating dioxygenase subunit alpha [Actinomycetota bacterium]|nr:aromatic ring-hydroxylating dioxygenase subunit alpha [Actinomycetota bacterium]